MAYKNMVFFDKNGSQINAAYDSTKQVWTVPVYFKESSIRLIETESVYIMERLLYSGEQKIGYPHQAPSTATKLTATPSLNDSEIGLFTILNHMDSAPDFVAQANLKYDVDVVGGDSIDITTGLVITSQVREMAMRVDIFVNSPLEGIFDNDITLVDDKGFTVAIFKAHAEVEGQDERMDSAQARLSRTIPESLEYIFRDSDINEDLPNHKLLNRKKKQFASQHPHILPYISSVRGLLSFVKYFGYYDVRVKEHWKNVETGGIQARELILETDTSALDRADNIPAYPYVRVPEMGLYYDIVRPRTDRQLDDDGLPLTEKAFAYSVDEVLIKLFGLKKYLEEEDVTGITRIVDIVGEYDIFEKTDINAWEDKTLALLHNYALQPKFTVDKNFEYLDDLRAVLSNYACSLPVDWTVETSSPEPIGEDISCWIGYFTPFNRQVPSFIDEPDIPIGKLVNLVNTTFFQPWAGVGLTWAQSAQNNLTVTWANIDKLNYYEVEWIVTYSKVNSIKKSFQFIDRNPAHVLTQQVILPYFGIYDVTLKLYGYDGEVASFTQNGFLTIYPKNPDFIAFYRLYESELQIWKTNYLQWADIWNQWRDKIFDNSRFTYEEADVQYKSMMTVRYIDLAYLGLKAVGIADEKWNTHSVASWKDHKYMSWAYTRFDREKPSNFTIQTLYPHGILQIGGSLFQFPADLNVNQWERAAELLNESVDPNVSNYYYVARPLEKPYYIDAVSKYDGRNGERWIGASNFITLKPNQRGLTWAQCKDFYWSDVPIHWKNAHEIYFAKSLENPYTFDNIKVYHGDFDVPTVIPVLMTIDNCSIVGKTQALWTIYDEFGNIVVDQAEGRYFAFAFEKPGVYSIKLSIIDTNGNEFTHTWNRRVRVYKPLDYQKRYYIAASA